jgi:AcrR family transcriptional regulator
LTKNGVYHMKKSARKTKELEFKKERIITVAEKLVFAKGITNITFQDIARAANYDKRTLYYYFKNKHEIYDAVSKKCYELLRSMIEDGLEYTRGTGWERLKCMGRIFIKFALKHPGAHKLLVLNWRLETVPDMSNDNVLSDSIFDLLVSVVQKGIQDGSLRRDIDAITTAYLLCSIAIGSGSVLKKNGDSFQNQFQRTETEMLREMIRFAEWSIKQHQLTSNIETVRVPN